MAVSTDTGCFAYANTTAQTHAVAAALRLPVTAEPSLDDIFEADRLARAYTRERFSDR